jgi:two-component system chemotaxis response regulator CheY
MEPDILVVDDSAAIRKILQRMLHQAGMGIRKILEAGNGREALRVLKTQKVGLILTDINMPEMDGIQLLAALKATPAWRDIPVVMIASEGGETKVGEAVRLGAACYIRKPFTSYQIKEKLVGILRPALR